MDQPRMPCKVTTYQKALQWPRSCPLPVKQPPCQESASAPSKGQTRAVAREEASEQTRRARPCPPNRLPATTDPNATADVPDPAARDCCAELGAARNRVTKLESDIQDLNQLLADAQAERTGDEDVLQSVTTVRQLQEQVQNAPPEQRRVAVQAWRRPARSRGAPQRERDAKGGVTWHLANCSSRRSAHSRAAHTAGLPGRVVRLKLRAGLRAGHIRQMLCSPPGAAKAPSQWRLLQAAVQARQPDGILRRPHRPG